MSNIDVSYGADSVNGNKALLVASHNSDKATYAVNFNRDATAAMDLCAIESGTTKIVRIRKIVITNPGIQGTAGLRTLSLIRTTTAGANNTVTPPKLDSGDGAYSGIAASGRTGGDLGTAGTTILSIPVYVPTALAAFSPIVIEFGDDAKAPTSIAGIANGLSLRDSGAASAEKMCGFVIFTEESP